MKIENEAQAVSEARKLLSGDAEAAYERATAIAQWVLDEYAKRTRAVEQKGPRQHLMVIADTYRDMTTWRIDRLRLPRDTFCRSQILVQCPGDNPNRLRGLHEDRVAIVRLSNRALTQAEQDVIGVYLGLGAKEFSPNDHVLIRSWLGVTTPYHDDSAP